MHITADIEIERPPGTIFNFTIIPDKEPSWISGIIESRQVTDGSVGEGTRVARVATFLGKRMEYVLEVTKFNPPTRIVMEPVKSPFPMIVTFEFEPRGRRTLARIILEGETKGFYQIAGPILARLSRSSIQKDLKKLKRIMEST